MNTEWKPIASAPKDGAAIWAIGQIYGKPFQYECHWNGIEWYHGFGDGWASLEPSHWMPLPPAPTSHPIPTGATGEDGQSAFERWLERTCPSGDVESVQRQWEASSDYADLHDPAAGDALEVLTDDEILHRWDTHVGDSPITESDKLCFAREIESDLLSKLSKRDAKDAARYRWWCDTGNDIASADTIGGKPTIDAAIDAAIAQQSQRKEA